MQAFMFRFMFFVIHNSIFGFHVSYIHHTFGTFPIYLYFTSNKHQMLLFEALWGLDISVCVCSCEKSLDMVCLLVQLKGTWVWMRLRPLNQRICPRRSSLSAQSISSSSSASSSPSSSPGSRPSPASFRQGRRSVGTVAITWKPGLLYWLLLWFDQKTVVWCYGEQLGAILTILHAWWTGQ